MARPMRFAAANFRLAAFSLALAVFFAPSPASAQTTGDPQPSQQIDAPSATPATVPAKAKKRLSKDFTLKSDSIWTDTGIDLEDRKSTRLNSSHPSISY